MYFGDQNRGEKTLKDDFNIWNWNWIENNTSKEKKTVKFLSKYYNIKNNEEVTVKETEFYLFK